MITSMRLHTAAVIASLVVTRIATAQANQDFSGVWKFNASRSEIRSLPAPPAAFLKVEQGSTSLMLAASSEEFGASATTIYPLDDRSEKAKSANSSTDTRTK